VKTNSLDSTQTLFTMEPITRAQLQNASANAAAEKARAAHREQEIKGQLAAEEFYKEIRRTAEFGAMTYASSKSMALGVAFDTMLFWTKEHFPDCDVSTEIRHMAHDPTYAVRVSWGENATSTDALEDRRLHKETSW
jgi:ABC-type uncharacterized transport system substrate-binding protein